jgi:hypothetical protein
MGVVGLLAVVNPRWFAVIVSQSNHQWIDTNKVLAPLDKRVNIDPYVLRHSRLLGLAVLATVALLVVRFY